MCGKKYKAKYCVEEMKLLLDDLLGGSGAKLRLHTFVAGVEKEGSSIKSLSTISKSGWEHWEGSVFPVLSVHMVVIV